MALKKPIQANLVRLQDLGLTEGLNGGVEVESHLAGLAFNMSECVTDPDQAEWLRHGAEGLFRAIGRAGESHYNLLNAHVLAEQYQFSQEQTMRIFSNWFFMFLVASRTMLDLSAMCIDGMTNWAKLSTWDENKRLRKTALQTSFAKRCPSEVTKRIETILLRRKWFRELERNRNWLIHRGFQPHFLADRWVDEIPTTNGDMFFFLRRTDLDRRSGRMKKPVGSMKTEEWGYLWPVDYNLILTGVFVDYFEWEKRLAAVIYRLKGKQALKDKLFDYMPRAEGAAGSENAASYIRPISVSPNNRENPPIHLKPELSPIKFEVGEKIYNRRLRIRIDN